MGIQISKCNSIQDCITLSSEYLSAHNITNAKKEIEWFLCNQLNCNTIDLYLNDKFTMQDINILNLNQFINRREKQEPFQYILESATFYGRDFVVNNDVLIPRAETETIIEIIKKNKFDNALEIGSGSGCIGITLILEKIVNKIEMLEISESASSIALKNVKKFNISKKHINFIQGDFFTYNDFKQYDLIVSNPPYISNDEFHNLEDTVKKFEPKKALCDNNQGLRFYERFAEIGMGILNSDGMMLLEFGGKTQVNSLKDIFKDYRITIFKDLSNHPRIIKVCL